MQIIRVQVFRAVVRVLPRSPGPRKSLNAGWSKESLSSVAMISSGSVSLWRVARLVHSF